MRELHAFPASRFCGLTLDAPDVARRLAFAPSYPLAARPSALARLADALRAARAEWSRRRAIAARYRALRAVDAATLRDLGWSDSELLSVACEAAGAVTRSRLRVDDARATATPPRRPF